MPTDKTDLRRTLRARRQSISAEERRLAARRLETNVAGTRLFRTSRRIACYLPFDGEIDATAVIERVQAMGKACYLPVLSRLLYDRLWFGRTGADTKFVRNRFGISEPDVKAAKLVRAQELDLILMPLVGFDAQGNRLGMGGGFYDRSLAFLNQRRHWRKPHLLGIAYDFQLVKGLKSDPWDVPLQGVITDQAVYYF